MKLPIINKVEDENDSLKLSSVKLTFLYLTDVSLCQNMAQSRFIMGAAHESKLTRGRCKNPSLGAPQSPNNKFSPASPKAKFSLQNVKWIQ